MRQTTAHFGLWVVVFAAAMLIFAASAVGTSTSGQAYFSTVHEPYGAQTPFAPYTDVQATSTKAYFGTVHEPYGIETPYAPFTDVKESSSTRYTMMHVPVGW